MAVLERWEDRLNHIVETVRQMSRATDPERMVVQYGLRMRKLIRVDGFLSLSRRGLQRPQFIITRSDRFTHQPNPWTQRDRLPVLSGGILADLIYADQPVILNDFNASPDDPAYDQSADRRFLYER